MLGNKIEKKNPAYKGLYKIYEVLATPASAARDSVVANDINVSSNKVSQNHKNHEIASIKQLVSNQSQILTELNCHISEKDLMSGSFNFHIRKNKHRNLY